MPQPVKGISFPFRFNARGGVAVSDNLGNGDHIAESIHQILATEPGERIIETSFGCRLRDVIFEPLDLTVHSIIKDRITRALSFWEPRVSVKEVYVAKTDETTVTVRVDYSVLDTYKEGSVAVAYTKG